MALLSMLALAYVRLVPLEMNSALRYRESTKAHYVAEAGIIDSLAYVQNELKNGNEPTPSGPVTRTGSLDGWNWETLISPDPQTPPLGDSALRFYRLQSRATKPGQTNAVWRIQCYVGEETFARFTRYIDDFPTSNYYNIQTTPFIEGHVHINDVIHIRTFPSLWTTTGDPAFKGFVTSASQDPASPDGIDYFGPGGPPYPDDAKYARLYLGGRAGLNTGVSRIELPENSNALARHAWGDTTAQPTAPGIHLNTDATGNLQGGVFIVGDVDEMVLGQDGSGNPTITVTQGGDVTTITEAVNAAAAGAPQGSTAVVGATSAVFPGIPNGVYYVDGNINSFKGVNRNAHTVAVNLTTNKEIIITGNVTRADTAVNSRPQTPRDVLGIVAYRVRVSDTIPRDYANPLQLYLSFVAGRKGDTNGGFIIDGWSNSALGTGQFKVYGAWATARMAITGNWDMSGSHTSGYSYLQYFDPSLITSPPPHYPTTGKLPVVSWREDPGD